MHDIETRLARCERQSRFLAVGLVLAVIVIAGTRLERFADSGPVYAQGTPPVLTASELVIVDAKGVVRVRIGTKLPDAVVGGKTKPRGDEAAGLILYDDTGQERGGYVTFKSSGYVGLTVDSRERMVGSLMAGPTGGALLQIRDGGLVQLRRDTDWVELRADEGGPHLNTVRAGRLTSRTPPMSADVVTFLCGMMRSELLAKATIPRTRAVSLCQERMSATDCEACFPER